MKKYGSVFMLYNRMILYRVLLVFAGMGLYFMHVKGMDSPQSTVIAFYADNFLHRLFPLEAYHIWVWNFVLILGLLIVSAA